MPIDGLVGGQGGDEGKGRISAILSSTGDYSICVRVPAPQAGHSIHYKGKRLGLAMVPCGFVNPRTRVLIGAGGLISLEKLSKEIEETGLSPKRLGIDYRATIVEPKHVEEERGNNNLMSSVGSVGTGVGPCRRDKIMRKRNLMFAKDITELQAYLTDSKEEIFKELERGNNILLEGDHGAKLDLIHGEYPFVTSRVVNVSGFLGELGAGPRDVRDVYVILKPYTTRVAPGPLEDEVLEENFLNWAHDKNGGGETGTVSGRLRRVGGFEWDNVQEVIRMNSANKIAITHLDLPGNDWGKLGYKNHEHFLDEVDKRLCKQWPYPEIRFLSYGPLEKDIIDFEKR